MDQELIDSFLIESSELLEGFGQTLIEIEDLGYRQIDDLIQKGFRQIHTVKGASGFLGFVVIEKLSHAMENLLDKIRSKEVLFDKEMITLLLKGTTQLEAAVQMSFESNQINVELLLFMLKKPLDVLNKKNSNHEDYQAIPQGELTWTWPFSEELLESSKGQGMLFLVKTNKPVNIEKIGDIKAELKTIGAIKADHVCEHGRLHLLVETILDLEMLCGAIEGVELEGICLDSQQIQSPLQQATKPEVLVSPEKQLSIPAQMPKSAKSQVDPTLRVRVPLLDSLMELSSELVLSRNQLMDKFGKETAFNVLSSQITDLQDSVMKLRLQPLQVVFDKIPRMVRELSSQLEKEVQLEINGKDVEVDRTTVESLSDPLIHIIRNSLDHGMEMPHERQALNKPRTGNIQISAYSQGGNVHIEISDDGKGIDSDLIALKALEKNIVTEKEIASMSISEKQALIFKAGFSTAQEISSVSGRGVGMDVVRSKIEELGGKVILMSKKGKGTTLRLLLPMTVAVVPALIVESLGGKAAIPRVNISELVLVDGTENNRIEKIGNRPVYRLREELLSVTPLEHALTGSGEFQDPETSELRQDKRLPGERRSGGDRGDRREEQQDFKYLIIMKAGSARYGLLVDQLHTPEEIVMKPLPSFFLNCSHFSGVSILGNGLVVPIVNPMELAQRAGISLSEEPPQKVRPNNGTGSATHHWIIAKRHDLQYAIPQQLVKRIDEVNPESIQFQDDQYYMLSAENTSTPIISIDEIDGSWDGSTQISGGFLIIPKYLPVEVGLHFDRVLGILNSDAQIERLQKNDCFMGKTVIYGKLTKIIDIYGLTDKAMPELKHMKHLPETSPEARKDLDILIAEDSPIFRSIMSKTFSELGLEVTFAKNGIEALALLKQEKFDILLSDIEMPEMDGLELIDAVIENQLNKDLVTVALTGNQDERIKSAALDRGYQHFMIKFDKKKFSVWLDQLILSREEHHV